MPRIVPVYGDLFLGQTTTGEQKSFVYWRNGLDFYNPYYEKLSGVAEINFGEALHVTGKVFNISDSRCTASNVILVTLSGAAPTDKDADETTMDFISLVAVARDGGFALYVQSITGSLYGAFKINYLIT